jgi:hypothetical protein
MNHYICHEAEPDKQLCINMHFIYNNSGQAMVLSIAEQGRVACEIQKYI